MQADTHPPNSETSLGQALLIKAMAVQPPRNDAELYTWCDKVLGVRFPRWSVSADQGAVAPFRYVADVFFERVSDLLCMASRDTYKTLGLAVIHLANGVFKPGCESVSIGAVERQSRKCYAYVLGFLNRTLKGAGVLVDTQDPEFAGLFGAVPGGSVVQSTIESRTVFKNGANLSILPGTMRAVSGDHPQKTAADEIEHWPWPVLQQFIGMASQGVTEHKAQRVLVSTRQSMSGTMAKLVDHREDYGLDLYWWSIWDAMESCQVRHGGCLCHKGGRLVSRENCGLYEVCQLKGLRSDGLKPRDEVERIHRLADPETWETQYECSKPSTKGLVYHQFQPHIHVTEAAEYNPMKGLIFLGGDDGYEDPYAILLAQKTLHSIDVFDMLYLRHHDPLDVKRILTTGEWPNDRWHDGQERNWVEVKKSERGGWVAGNIDTGWWDPRSPAEIELWRKVQVVDGTTLPSYRLMPAPTGAGHGILDRIKVVRARLKLDPSHGPRLRVHPRCVALIREVTSLYGFPIDRKTGDVVGEKPDDRENHASDALAYLTDGMDGPRPGVR